MASGKEYLLVVEKVFIAFRQLVRFGRHVLVKEPGRPEWSLHCLSAVSPVRTEGMMEILNIKKGGLHCLSAVSPVRT